MSDKRAVDFWIHDRVEYARDGKTVEGRVCGHTRAGAVRVRLVNSERKQGIPPEKLSHVPRGRR